MGAIMLFCQTGRWRMDATCIRAPNLARLKTLILCYL